MNNPPAPAAGKSPVVGGFAIAVACGLGLLALLSGGFANLAFYLLAVLDFLTGARLWARLPPFMWVFWGLVFGGALAFWLEAPLYGLRRHRWLIIAAPLVLLFTSAMLIQSLRPSPPRLPDPTAPPPPPPIAPNFAGGWDTGKWGAMSLQQDGGHVFGTYDYKDGVIEGTVSPGTSRLTFRWRNRDGGSNGVGYFDLASDAQSFAGGWTEGETLSGNGQDWSGKRTAGPPPSASFTGVWDTEWGAMRLNQGVRTVTGTYDYGAGTIEGNLDGATLRFRWVNRVTGQSGTGKFTLKLYGQSFEGTWNAGNNPDSPGDAWTGRLKEKPSK